jgi:hypothetical protein
MKIGPQLQRLKQLQDEDAKKVRSITVCFKSMSCTHDVVVVPVEDFTPRYTAGVYIRSCGEPSLEQWEAYEQQKTEAANSRATNLRPEKGRGAKSSSAQRQGSRR